MKKLIIAAICIILLTGCGSEKNVKQKDTKQVEQQVENNANLQKTYQEKEFDLGFQNKTEVKLESNDEKNLFLKIDEESISLSDEKDLYFNFNFCKLKAKLNTVGKTAIIAKDIITFFIILGKDCSPFANSSGLITAFNKE